MKESCTLDYTVCDCCKKTDDLINRLTPETAFDLQEDSWEDQIGIDFCDQCRDKYVIWDREKLLQHQQILQKAEELKSGDMSYTYFVVEQQKDGEFALVKWLS